METRDVHRLSQVNADDVCDMCTDTRSRYPYPTQATRNLPACVPTTVAGTQVALGSGSVVGTVLVPRAPTYLARESGSNTPA